MISCYWLPLALGAFALAFVVIADLGTAEKRLQRRVARIPAVGDPAFTCAVTGIFATPFVPGTRIATLVNGDYIFPACSRRSPTRSDRLISRRSSTGRARSAGGFADALAEPASRGVAVNILLDWVGSQPMGGALLDRVVQGGGRVIRFHPPRWRHLARMNPTPAARRHQPHATPSVASIRSLAARRIPNPPPQDRSSTAC